jgi:transposase
VSKPERLRRVEVITGVERRRRWSLEEKLAIVTESMVEGVIVSDVARRHGISPQQLFGWRSKVRAELAAAKSIEAPVFVPTVIEMAAPAASAVQSDQRAEPNAAPWTMEITFDAVIVRIRGGADAGTLTAVLKALRVRP